MTKRDDKRQLRILKRVIKRRGGKHRRSTLKRQLQDNPEEAHLAEENFGRNVSKNLNALDRPLDETGEPR